MALHLTDEEYKALMKRRALPYAPAPAPKLQGEQASVSYADEVSAWAGEETPKRSKYGNQRVEIDGIRFDSKHEAACYHELLLRMRAGELRAVLRQVPFDLPGGIRYYADFVTIAPDMKIEGVYDAKSEATRKNRVYINKKKQMKACWDIEIREI